ncbi:hypothetical protein F511_37978 [Dorcoceras hygrometricum]|uniref:Uncharacterized protein n=1 Tax=Dorcoceras hygrometricum TaxID=472368 RepID=A0A2Z7DA64_9LAMI|nr:hypothetical protein F511_37978 [Dorcoceras hygrometricum]
MADQTSDDEVFDFSNIEFTREDLVSALNDMVIEYMKLSHSFEEIKAEKENLKNSSIESSTDTLEDIDSLKTELNSIGYPRMSASGESSTTMHRLLHASGSHPIPPPNDPKTNQYNQDLRLIHSTNGNHLESPNEGSSIDHQVTIYLHAQNITMFPTNETWYFASQILVSSSGGLILILTAQSTRN